MSSNVLFAQPQVELRGKRRAAGAGGHPAQSCFIDDHVLTLMAASSTFIQRVSFFSPLGAKLMRA